jgi:cytoskeleton-associated protein 5
MLLEKMPDMMRKDTEKLVEETCLGVRKQPQRFTRKEAARRAVSAAAPETSAGATASSAPAAGPSVTDDPVIPTFSSTSLETLSSTTTCKDFIASESARFCIISKSSLPLTPHVLVQVMDPYDFADPVDILAKLDKSFWEGLAASKWSERRDALQNLKSLSSSPKLAPGDYADVVRELRKVGCCYDNEEM